MKLVSRPPQQDAETLFSSVEAYRRLANGECSELLKRATDEYMPWDKFKRQPLPPGMPHEAVWHFMRIGRHANERLIPLKDLRGKNFTYWTPDSVLKTLSDIDRAAESLTGRSNLIHLPGSERYAISSLMDEAIASSQLEGAATTQQEAKEMLRAGRKPRDSSELMISNNWHTMQYLRANITEPLTPEEICKIHALVTEQTFDDPRDAGRIRTRDDVVVMHNEEVIHTPPPAVTLAARLQEFCEFANSDEDERWIHPLIKAIILHFWIGYDHPFVDGNGRTARAIFYRYLLSRGYWIFEYLAISRYFVRAPIQYARSYLYSETDGNDLNYFLVYNLRVIQRALEDLKKYLEDKQEELKRIGVVSELKKYTWLNDRQRALLIHAYEHPETEYTIAVHQNSHSITYETARTDLLKLARRDLFFQELRGRKRIFRPTARVLHILSSAREN